MAEIGGRLAPSSMYGEGLPMGGPAILALIDIASRCVPKIGMTWATAGMFELRPSPYEVVIRELVEAANGPATLLELE